MLDRNLLRHEMKENNCSIDELANVCGISRSAMYRRLKGQVDFKVNEIIRCTGRLHLSIDRRNRIFFA
ncbi:MAG: helix-turn-helix domain-containing protein [Clostridiales bacterium]|nr:helix-turn-helix domain-containing protein [Clostridiales bacterium]